METNYEDHVSGVVRSVGAAARREKREAERSRNLQLKAQIAEDAAVDVSFHRNVKLLTMKEQISACLCSGGKGLCHAILKRTLTMSKRITSLIVGSVAAAFLSPIATAQYDDTARKEAEKAVEESMAKAVTDRAKEREIVDRQRARERDKALDRVIRELRETETKAEKEAPQREDRESGRSDREIRDRDTREFEGHRRPW